MTINCDFKIFVDYSTKYNKKETCDRLKIFYNNIVRLINYIRWDKAILSKNEEDLCDRVYKSSISFENFLNKFLFIIIRVYDFTYLKTIEQQNNFLIKLSEIINYFFKLIKQQNIIHEIYDEIITYENRNGETFNKVVLNNFPYEGIKKFISVFWENSRPEDEELFWGGWNIDIIKWLMNNNIFTPYFIYQDFDNTNNIHLICLEYIFKNFPFDNNDTDMMNLIFADILGSNDINNIRLFLNSYIKFNYKTPFMLNDKFFVNAAGACIYNALSVGPYIVLNEYGFLIELKDPENIIEIIETRWKTALSNQLKQKFLSYR